MIKLKPDEEDLLMRVLEDDMHNDRSFWDTLSTKEKEWVVSVLRSEDEGLNLNTLWEYDFLGPVPTIQEAMDANYVDDDGVEVNYYFGPDFKHLYPFWKNEMKIVLSPDSQIFEHILTGSIGGGKTTLAVFENVFKLVQLSRLRNPHAYYNLMASSPIVFSLFNVTKERADLSAYTMFKNIVNTAPYFRENFPVDTRRVADDTAEDDKKYAVKLPKNIRIILGSKPDSAISTNVIGGILDEVNFKELKTDKNTQGMKGTQAYKIYTNVIKRILSRFAADDRKKPGILCNVSSRQSITDFLEEHMKGLRDQGRVCTCTEVPHTCDGKSTRIVEASIYKMKPAGTYSTTKFRVQVGNKYIGHRILAGDESPAEGCDVEEVPIDFIQAYENDIDGAIRDISGIATLGTQPFLRDPEKLIKCVNYSRTNPFPPSVELYSQMVKGPDGLFTDIGPTLEDYLIKESLVKHFGQTYQPRYYPGNQRFLHMDLSLTGDCTGVAMGCVSELIRVRRVNRDGSISESVAPRIWFDFLLQIVPVKGFEIDYAKIRQFIYTLRNVYNFPLDIISTDTYQSSDMRQQLEKEGFNTEIISMDTPRDDNALATRMVIMEGRIDMPFHPILIEETSNLFHDKEKRKVDHRQGKSKDVFDAFGGVICSIGKVKDIDALVEVSKDRAEVIMPVNVTKGEDKPFTGESVFGDSLTRISYD